MESEKVKEIKKALKCCGDRLCEVCPRLKQEPNQEEDCRLALIGQSLTVIKHQDFQIGTLKVQVEKLEKELKKEHTSNHYYRNELQFNESRIAELEKENEKLNRCIKNIQNGFDSGEFISKGCQITSLKRFVEILKSEANLFFEGRGDKKGIEVVTLNRIDETLKEFINE